MRFLVTRPRDDAEAFAQTLRARGHVAIVAPVMELRVMTAAPIALEGVQAVLVTSANGVRALAAGTKRRDVTLYAVGPQTAEAARDAGLLSSSAPKVILRLWSRRLASWTRPGKRCYTQPGRRRQDVKAAGPQARGFKIETAVLYEAVPVAKLPAETEEALRDGTVDGVFLFSPRSARIFAALAGDAGLAAQCAKLIACCISAATAEALNPLSFARVVVAGSPNQDAMLNLVPPQGVMQQNP
jgi:uroporphyrinogen-III synthase